MPNEPEGCWLEIADPHATLARGDVVVFGDYPPWRALTANRGINMINPGSSDRWAEGDPPYGWVIDGLTGSSRSRLLALYPKGRIFRRITTAPSLIQAVADAKPPRRLKLNPIHSEPIPLR